MLISLRGCAGWTAPLLFAYGIRHVFAWPCSTDVCTFHLDKTNKMTLAPCKDSGHPHSLIRVFSVRLKKAHREDSEQPWSESSMGAQFTLWFYLSRCGSNNLFSLKLSCDVLITKTFLLIWTTRIYAFRASLQAFHRIQWKRIVFNAIKLRPDWILTSFFLNVFTFCLLFGK